MKIKGSTVDLAKRIVELESQCDQLNEEKMKLMEQVVKGKCKEEHMKDKYVKVKLKYGDMKDKLDSEEMKWREEDDKIREERRQLKVQNRKLEIDLNAAVSKRTGVDDTAKKRRVTEADAECLKSLLEERDGRITNLIGKNEVLERQNSRLEREKQKLVEQKNLELNQKVQVFEREKEQMRALEAKNHKLGEQIIWELNQKIRVFEREKEETVAEVSKLQKEKSDEAERNLNLSTTIEVEKKRLKEVEGKTFELLKRIGALERAKKARQENVSKLNREKNEKVKEILNEKMAFEEETNKMIVELSNKIKSLEEQKRETEAKVSQANMEKNEATERFSKEKIAAEAEKRVLEEENKKMVVVLTNGNEALKKEQKEMEAKFSRAIMEKNVEIERTFKEADAEKRALGEEHKKMVLVLTKRIEALGVEKREMETKYSKAKTDKNAEIQRILIEKVTAEAEKRAFEEESKKEVLVLVKRIESLEEEERGMEAEVHRATMEKIAAEAEKRALEEESKKMVAVLTKRNESLEEEKRETEAKVSRAYKERNTEMERILKEKMALKEKGEKMSSERDEVIQVLQQDIETLEARNKELEREKIRLVLKREEDDELYHQSQGSNLVGILGSGSAAAENHGRILDETSKKMSMRWIEARQEEEMEARKEAAPAQWKRRAWNTFVQYLRNRELTPELCSGAHVVEFLNNLNQFGKSKAHVSACPCPLRQAWFSNGCLVSSLHAAFEENGGRPDSNPFAAHSVTSYLRELREAQSKARGAP